jgi:transposase
MAEVARGAVARVGVDLFKRVFQVHAVDSSGRVVTAKPMAPHRFFAWCAELPAGCLVGMEACGGTHHMARRLRGMGLQARLRCAGCWPRCLRMPATS